MVSARIDIGCYTAQWPVKRNHPYRHYIGVFATNTERDMQVVDLMSRVELGDVVHPMINLIV